jgi:hypothetical protein
LDVEVVEEEHSVEWLHEELDLLGLEVVEEGRGCVRAYEHICCNQKCEAHIVWRICFLFKKMSSGLLQVGKWESGK